MTVQEWAKANVKAGDLATKESRHNIIKKCARQCGTSTAIAGAAIRASTGSAETTTGRGKTLALFRQQYDIKLKIRQGIASHLKGVYMTDQEFREVCGVPTNEWRRYADETEFDPNKVKIRGILYWAAPKMVQDMKEIAGVI